MRTDVIEKENGPDCEEYNFSAKSTEARSKDAHTSTAHTSIAQTSTAHATTGINLKKALGLSGLVMLLALPIGLYPRVLLGKELDGEHAKLVAALPTVTVEKVAASQPDRKLSLPGTVEGIVDTPIYARSNGFVKERFADIGDHVTKGQLLADVETPDVDESVKENQAMLMNNVATRAQTKANLDTAKADYRAAIADLAQSKADLAQVRATEKFAQTSRMRWAILAKQGAVATQDADQKDTEYKTSVAASAAAEEKIRSSEAKVVAAKGRIDAEEANLNANNANIDAAKARQTRSTVERDFNRIVAPFTGIITERNIDRGTLITSGSENSKMVMYRLARIDTVKVFIDVPQYASSGIRVGQKVSVNLKEFPGRTFEGKVERTSVALDANSRTLKTEIHIVNTDLALAPGMYADVNFAVQKTGHTFVVPASALITGAEGTRVLVASNDTVHYKNIQVGDDFGKQVEVTSGLDGSESIVRNPKDSLKDGEHVQIEKL